MAHKNLVGGTSYDTKGGKCLVGGTGYDVKKGRALVNGTGYDVAFSQPCTVTINGAGNAIGYSTYVEIDGVTYESEATVQVPAGTPMTAYGWSKYGMKLGGVYLNDVQVAGGVEVSGACSYDYTIQQNITVEFELVSGSPTTRIGYTRIVES